MKKILPAVISLIFWLLTSAPSAAYPPLLPLHVEDRRIVDANGSAVILPDGKTARFTPAANLAGLPALCLPAGFAANMPVAVQLVSRPFNENTLLAFGRRFQEATDWHKRRPST